MKITDLRTMQIVGPRVHSVGGVESTFTKIIVRVDAENGMYGLGEVEYYMGAQEALKYIRQLLIGRDVFNAVPFVSEVMYGSLPPHTAEQLDAESHFTGPFPLNLIGSPTDSAGGPIIWALSGVAMAMFDLAGKAAGTPSYNLLGGKYRDKITVYLDRSAPSEEEAPKIEAWRKMGADAVADGFTQFKFDAEYVAPEHTADVWSRTMNMRQINATYNKLAAVREEVGWDVDICVDCHRLYNVTSAIQLANALAPLRLTWLEDPTSAQDPDACARVREKIPIPICTGEGLSPEEARHWIDRGACDVIHPDILFCGGPYEMHKIAECAELHSMPIAMHGNGSSLATIAAAHVAAASRNFVGLEYHFIETRWVAELVIRDGQPLFSDGKVQLTDKPGLGIEINKGICERYLAPGESLF